MITLSVEQLCQATSGSLKAGYATITDCQNLTINSVSTDTRTIQAGDLFIALKGPSFDAHSLLDKALTGGAAILLVEQSAALHLPASAVVIEVQDTRIALGLLGRYVREQIKDLKAAAVTGSNGKTTCKELLSSILAAQTQEANNVLATAGNFNNDIGVPLTLLRLEQHHQFAVLELGANHIGEIAYTSALAKPDVALVNNIMPAHLEGFGSIEGVAKAKSEIWSNLGDEGIAVVNLDAKFAEQFIEKLQKQQRRYLTFSRQLENDSITTADVYALQVSCNEVAQASFKLCINPTSKIINSLASEVMITLNLPGLHNVSNALAAATMALALGCDLSAIEQGLSGVQQVAGRVNSKQLSPNLTVIDDTYNANSASVKAGIDLLSEYQATKVLVLGDMGELGEYAEQEHQTIGEYAQQHHIDKLFSVGNLSQLATNEYNARSKNLCAKHFTDKQQLKLAINSYLNSEKSKVVVLVKGSRSAKMEEIVASIQQAFTE